jgi:uncharacterized protein YndB with AHSA1/START domain
MTAQSILSYSLLVHSSPQCLWNVLTLPKLMQQWMGEPEMNLDIQTDWVVGHSFSIQGFHHILFENKGVLLAFEPNTLLSYSSLSSVSKLVDSPENYSVIIFHLKPVDQSTELTITVSHFPTETIFKHLEFYWRTAIYQIKNKAESIQITAD